MSRARTSWLTHPPHAFSSMSTHTPFVGEDGFCAHGAVTEKTIAESKTKTAVAQFLNESESWAPRLDLGVA